jgi:hypothetical protein
MFNREVMSVGDWIAFGILMAIPLVNVLFWVVLLLSSGTNKSLKNLLYAQIFMVIAAVILFMFFGAAMVAFFQDIPAPY